MGPPLSWLSERPRPSGGPGRLPAATERLGPPKRKKTIATSLRLVRVSRVCTHVEKLWPSAVFMSRCALPSALPFPHQQYRHISCTTCRTSSHRACTCTWRACARRRRTAKTSAYRRPSVYGLRHSSIANDPNLAPFREPRPATGVASSA